MNIGINARLLLHNKLEGIGWFSYQILSRMVKNHPEHTFYFIYDRPPHASFQFADNVIPIVLSPQARHPILYHIWFNWKLAPMLRKLKIDIFYSPENFTTHRTKIANVVTIHDLAYKHYPNFVDKAHQIYYKKYQPLFARKADTVITVSNFTKEDIIHHYQLPEDKIKVVYNAANPAFRPLNFEERQTVKASYTESREYFLYVGALHPRKNIINLLKGFVHFKRRQKSALKLVIIGRMAWQTAEIEEAQRRMPYREDVIWLGYQPVEVITQLTGAAYAMVYPSLFEGFGIPIIEAMACNVPSIVSNTSSMPEVLGNAGLIVDPHDPKDIGEKMGLMYKDERLRNTFIQACATELQRFDWDRSAEEVWNILMETYQAKNSKSN